MTSAAAHDMNNSGQRHWEVTLQQYIVIFSCLEALKFNITLQGN
jgi:hypothetical protein